MNKRITQLIARYIGVAATVILAKVGIEDDGTISASIETISAAIVAIGGFVLDVAIHKVETGGVLKAAGEKKE